MRYLLDTHTLLWFLMGDSALSDQAKAIINDGDNDIMISIASLWEISIKVRLGKLELGSTFDNLFPEQLHRNFIEIVPIELSHLSEMLNLELHHRDPFDRLIIAQAIVESVPIIGKDRVFVEYPVNVIW